MTRHAARLFVPLACLPVIVCLFAGPALARQGATPAPAQSVVDAAVARAAAEHKAVWVDFGASWCGWCKKLDAFFHDPTVADVIQKHYLIVNLTVQESADKKALENPGGEALMTQYGGAQAGLPFYAFVDGSGKRVANSMALPNGSNIGFPGNSAELTAFITLIDKTAPALTGAERAKLMDYLHKVVPSTN